MHVFLDIDGVLSTEDTYDAWYAAGRPEGERHTLLDPDCVALVNELCATLEADVVVSSSWRAWLPWDDVVGALRRGGFTAPIVGRTPELAGQTRGAEIAAWIEAEGVDPSRVLILEDAEDVRPFAHRQVQTSFVGQDAGFRAEHLASALALLT